MNNVLELRNVGKAFLRYSSEWKRIASWFGANPEPVDTHWAVRNVSFSIARGESVGLIGRNGAGKSTILKLIAGTLRPSEGSVQVHGRIAAILELGMGFNPEFTGRQNAWHAAGLMGFDREQIQSAMPELEAFAEIGEYFDQPTRIYSSGMQMRVAFAVATAFAPDLLLIDEALAVGDLSFQAKCFARIESMRAKGCAMVFVSHSVEEIVKHCARALFIDAGTLRADAASGVVANAYLDHLWGKQRSVLPASAGVFAAFDGAGVEDRFHLRPMYRKEEHRWGGGGARILDYYLESDGQPFPSPINAGSVLRIVIQVAFDEIFARPVFGLLIKTHDGIFLFGTNSVMSGDARFGAVEAGACVSVEFTLPVGLNTGAFLISVGVSSDDGTGELVPLDRRYDSILVKVLHRLPIWGIVDLNASCRLLSEVQHGEA